MMPRALGMFAVSALLVAGCSAAPESPANVRDDHGRLADAALVAGDYARAALLYRHALTQAPQQLALHYGLAVVATHLGLNAEAIREFGWILQHGVPGQPEMEIARRWLTSIGVLSRTSTLSSSPSATEVSAAATARVEGRVAPVEIRPGPVSRMQLFLVEHPSRGRHYPVRTDDDGRFQFPTVAPGVYKLSDRISGPPTWQLRVEAKPGQVVFVDLGPENTTRSRDDFPDHH